MSKISIIAKREFLSRVQKKTFLLSTIGLPLLIFGLYALIIYFSVKNTDNFRIAVADEANYFNKALEGKKGELIFEYVNKPVALLTKEVDDKVYDAYLHVPKDFTAALGKDSLKVIAGKSVGFMTREMIERKIEKYIENKRLLQQTGLDKAQLDSLKNTSIISFGTTKSNAEEGNKAGISYAVGFGFGFLIYIVLLIYGMMVMRGVMEEKTNRIAEVMVSSVKPYQLMMGKILGIGSVGLLQFVIWIVLMFGLTTVLGLVMPGAMDQMQNQPMQPGMVQAANAMQKGGAAEGILKALSQVNIPLIVGCFLFYFLGGYFLYASLFAAVGSTVNEDPQEAQSLSLPITMPIIFGIVIMMQAVNNPNSPIAVFGSLFPFTSPIVMMARIAHGVPDGVTAFQLVLSMVLLVATFIGTTWFAGKIYRTGILLYGKKATWKEMLKWVMRKS